MIQVSGAFMKMLSIWDMGTSSIGEISFKMNLFLFSLIIIAGVILSIAGVIMGSVVATVFGIVIIFFMAYIRFDEGD